VAVQAECHRRRLVTEQALNGENVGAGRYRQAGAGVPQPVRDQVRDADFLSGQIESLPVLEVRDVTAVTTDELNWLE
jgi:hypothetical protein